MIVYKSSLFGLYTLTQIRGSAMYKALVPSLTSSGLLVLYSYCLLRRSSNNNNNNDGSVFSGDNNGDDFGSLNDGIIAKHPYMIGAYMTFVSFLVVFRLNFSYQRYWEGATAIHQMTSKWLDAAICMASFHYQSDIMTAFAPPTFAAAGLPAATIGGVSGGGGASSGGVGDDHHHDGSGDDEHGGKKGKQPPLRQQRHCRTRSLQDVMEAEVEVIDILDQQKKPLSFLRQRKKRNNNNNNNNLAPKSKSNDRSGSKNNEKGKRKSITQQFQSQFKIKQSGGTEEEEERQQKKASSSSSSSSSSDGTTTHNTTTTTQQQEELVEEKQQQHQTIPSPTVFLQELVHLFSLLSAVALSTLRNDIEGAPAPLVEYFPGQPMAPVNPDDYFQNEYFQRFSSANNNDRHNDHNNNTNHKQHSTTATTGRDFGPSFSTEYNGQKSQSREMNPCTRAMYFCLGLSRNDKQRTLYNAARPFRVLGGVSDGEILKLQHAHGPCAKMALCTMWLQEFITREYMAGSTGNVAYPILSRVYQFISDGNKGYNIARKLAYVPFPFPHAQITTVFTLVTVLAIMPLLYLSYVNSIVLAVVMNFITVSCFLGIHEVARELENPMSNVPNDLPLLNIQSQVNEALVTVYAGYHPDSWWIVEKKNNKNITNNERNHNI